MCQIVAPYWTSFRWRVSFICIPNSHVIMSAHALHILWPKIVTSSEPQTRSTSAHAMACCGTKPLFEPMVTHHQQLPMIFIWGQFNRIYLSHQSLKLPSKLLSENSIQISKRSKICCLVISEDLMVRYLIGCWIRPQRSLWQGALLTVQLENQHWKYSEISVNL